MYDHALLHTACCLPSASPSSAPTAPAALSDHSSDDHTLEYALLIAAIIVAIVVALYYALRVQRAAPFTDEEVMRGDRVSSGGHQGGNEKSKNKGGGGFQAVSSGNSNAVALSSNTQGMERSDLDKFLDDVDPSLFEIEMIGGDNEDEEEEELVF